ncbi:MAG TPA: hypothetical protein VGB71_02830 [Flavisolibacter sp.]
MPEKQIQEYLFQRIKEALPPGKPLVETIAEVLHVSQDSAYRRIRGETLLVLEEAKLLCQQYNISLDQLLNLSGNSVVFRNIELNSTISDFTIYLKGILHELKNLATCEQRSIYYITIDIPFFYQFCYQPMFAFRYFFWMKSVAEHPDFAHRKFSLDCLPQETKAIGKEILRLYCQIPSVEIWNTECVNGMLTQLAYYQEAGIVKKEEAMSVYGAIRQTVEHLQVQAEYGTKFIPGENPQAKKQNFQLFQNRVGLGDNTILTSGNGSKKLYLNYDALSYMTTTDEAFCNMAQQQLKTITRRSTLISNVGEKHRNIFFNHLFKKIPSPNKQVVKRVS